MHTTQLAAARIIGQVLQGRNLNQLLSSALSSMTGLNPQQRGALQDLCYGTLRYYGQLSRVLEKLLHKPLQDEQLRCLLLVALYQLQYSKAASHAVVNSAVSLIRRSNASASGLVNAVLRNFLRKPGVLAEVSAESDEGYYSYPQWWINKLKSQYGEQAEAILLAGNCHPPMTLRINCRRTSAAEYLQLLANQKIQARQISSTALLLEHPVGVDKLPGFSDGLVSVQDAGAQLAANLLDVQEGMLVLDACAAPGGKTSHLLESAELDLLALDKDEQRLVRVKENLQRLQLHARLQIGDAMHPENWWDGRLFQRILADVPCSASGVVRRHPDIKWLRRPEDIDSFAQQQLRILDSLWYLLDADGKLLYITCSVFEQENQRVIEKFLHQHKDAQQLSLPGLIQGQFLPDDQHDGFFYALIVKMGSEIKD